MAEVPSLSGRQAPLHPRAVLENNEASAKLTTANGVTFTSRSSRLSSQTRYRSLDQWLTCFNVIGYWVWLSRRKRSAICSGVLISVHMISYDINRRYGICVCTSRLYAAAWILIFFIILVYASVTLESAFSEPGWQRMDACSDRLDLTCFESVRLSAIVD